MGAEHASRLAARWVDDPDAPPWRTLHGTAVLADLSGFTSLTEKLTLAAGVEGAEVLHRVISTCFDAVLSAPLALGGDVVNFAGDAALVWFDAGEHDDHVTRAADAARHMVRGLRALPAALTAGKRLRVSVGVHTGAATAVLAGTSRRMLFFCGPDVSLVTTLQGAAGANEILVSPEVAARLPRSALGAVNGPGTVLRGTPATTPTRRVERSPADDVVEAAALLGPDVLELLRSGDRGGDHRTVSIGFVRVPGTDTLLAAEGPGGLHVALTEVVDLVGRINTEESIELLDADVGVNAVKLMIASGAPRAVEHDEEHLISGLWRTIEESGRPLAAGAQRGDVFGGLLGVEGRRGYTLMGDPVNVAARALSLAGDGELVVGEGLEVSSRTFVEATSLGPKALKNRSQPVEMWRVTAVHRRVVRRRGTAVSVAARPAETTRLRTAWKRTVDDGRGGTVLLAGDAGMGASDLIADLVDTAGAAATALVPDPNRARTPYSGVEAIVAELAASEGIATPARHDAWRWLFAHTDRLPDGLRPWAPDALAAVTDSTPVGSDPRTTALRTRAVLAALAAAVAPRPWLLAVDDVHLVDDASRHVLDRLRALTADQPVLMVVSHEPGESPLPVTDATLVVPLDPLDDDTATELVTSIAPALRDDVIARIVAAAGGNVFVLNELASNPREGALPDSLQRLAQWSVDSLPPVVRQRVREASVCGATLTLPDVAEVTGRPELEDTAAWTAAARVIRPVDHSTLRFRHEAYRQAAYQSLPFQRRRELHAALADRIAAGPDPDDAVLAEHLELAGRGHEAYPRAARAGRAAKAAGALPEAAVLLARAARLAHHHDPASEGALLVEEGEARVWLSDLDGGDRCYRAAARVIADPLLAGQLCHHRADLALTRGEFTAARKWAEQGLAVTATLGAEAEELRCWLVLDQAARLQMIGDEQGALALAEAALADAQRIGSPVMEGLVHLHLDMVLSELADPRALHHSDEAVRLFAEAGHDRFLQHALTNSGLTHMYFGNWDEALSLYQRALDGHERSGVVLSRALTINNIGFLQLRQGRLADADDSARRALRLIEAAGVGHTAGYPRLLRSQVAAREGRWADADRLLEAAREAFAAVGDDALVLDCDVTALAHLGMRGEHAEVVRRAAALARRMDDAEVEVRITFERVVGASLASTGDAAGVERVERALATARDLHLLYEVWCCLDTLTRLTGDAETIAERDALTERLGIVV